jgi:LPS-assembly protein
MIRAAWAAGAVVALAALLSASEAQAQAQAPLAVQTPVGEVTVVADRIEQIGAQGVVVATGNVEMTRGTARLTADRVEFNRETGDAVAQGRVVFYDGEDRLQGDRIDYNFRTGTGVVYDGEARTAPYYRLSGERMERIGESVYRVRRGVFTTCEADPAPWSFHIGSATADLNSFVWGTNVSFWVRNIPLIPWFPFFAAAIRRERQTGFLFPKVGESSRKGLSAELPFFWAISDSQDATIAPLMFERVGPGVNAEYRYVLSTEHRGNLRAFYVNQAMKHGGDRGWIAMRDDWTLTPRLTLKVDTRTVTDDEIFRDFGDPLEQRSEQRAESNVFVSQRWDTWSLVGNAFWYQDLTATRPVELHRLPEVTLVGVRRPVGGVPGLLWELSGGAVHFVRDVGSDGTRLDVNPRLSRPISADGVFTLTPFIGGRLTAYDQRVTGVHYGQEIATEQTQSELVLRRILEAGADVETTASRVYHPARWGVDALLHTVEPRLNYTWIDGRSMDRLPSWTDVDRIGDSSRVEYSLTNRLRGRTLAPPGTTATRLEMLRLLVGHSIDARDGRSGDIVGDLLVQPTPMLSFRGNLRHDTHGEGVQIANTDVSAQVQRVSASVGTRYAQAQRLSFLQAATTAEITRHLVGRISTNWDMRTNTFVENRFAVDLRFQCYAFTVEYVDRSKEAGKNGEDEIRFALNLLGVGGPVSNSIGLGSLTSSGGTSSR